MTQELPDPVDDGFELVMPFVLAQSNGGPYDDEAYAAGWRMGALEAQLKLAEQFHLTMLREMLPTVDAPQIDLLAMRYGFTVGRLSASLIPGEIVGDAWSLYTFGKNGHESRGEIQADAIRLAISVCFNPDIVDFYPAAEVIERLNGVAADLEGITQTGDPT